MVQSVNTNVSFHTSFTTSIGTADDSMNEFQNENFIVAGNAGYMYNITFHQFFLLLIIVIHTIPPLRDYTLERKLQKSHIKEKENIQREKMHPLLGTNTAIKVWLQSKLSALKALLST